MTPSLLIYVGLVAALLGSVSLVRPLKFIGIASRRRGALALGTGLLIAGTGCALPVQDTRITVSRTQLDGFAPEYQFHEIHMIRVAASRDQVYRAIKSVAADEIQLFHTLTWIRRLGRSGPESILNAPERVPLLEVATRSGFVLLAEDPNHEVLIGGAVAVPPGFRPKRQLVPEDFKTVRPPGFAIATMNFLIDETEPGSCLVTTETRVHATDLATERKFALYWRMIYPGSALIRRMWLRAVKRRAEAGGAHGSHLGEGLVQSKSFLRTKASKPSG